MRQDREKHMQTYRRARSLSPNKHPRSVPQEGIFSSKASAGAPSQRKEHLEQLRQEAVDRTRYENASSLTRAKQAMLIIFLI